MSLAEKFETIADSVYEKGKEKERSDFWDGFLSGGLNISFSFAYAAWKDAIYNPTRPIIVTYYMYYNSLFYLGVLTDTKVDIDVSGCNNTATGVFGRSKLKTIRKIIVSEKTTYGTWFTQCSDLENITFEGVIGNDLSFADSPLLTVESMLNIFGCLRDNKASGATNTITLGATNLNKLTDAEKAIATNRGWTLA